MNCYRPECHLDSPCIYCGGKKTLMILIIIVALVLTLEMNKLHFSMRTLSK